MLQGTGRDKPFWAMDVLRQVGNAADSDETPKELQPLWVVVHVADDIRTVGPMNWLSLWQLVLHAVPEATLSRNARAALWARAGLSSSRNLLGSDSLPGSPGLGHVVLFRVHTSLQMDTDSKERSRVVWCPQRIRRRAVLHGRESSVAFLVCRTLVGKGYT